MTQNTKLTLTAASGLLVLLISLPSVVGPLICMFVWKDDAEAEAFAKRCINIQISWFIWLLLAALSCLILVGIVLFPLLLIVWLVCSIIDVAKASSGDTSFRFPLTIDFLGLEKK